MSKQPRAELIGNKAIYLDPPDTTLSDYTVVTYRVGNDYFQAHNYRKDLADADLDLLSLQGTRIPIRHIRPRFPKGFTIAPTPLPADVFVKRCELSYYDGSSALARTVRDEARVLEALKLSPHPNLAKYHGCVVEGKRISGLCFARYPRTLLQRIRLTESGVMPPPTLRRIGSWCHDIQNGLDHLHGLGYVHQDLDPRNVMINAEDNAVIIDFDSCQKEGERRGLKSFGTPPWILEQATRGELAHRDYDYEGLRVIRMCLEDSRKLEHVSTSDDRLSVSSCVSKISVSADRDVIWVGSAANRKYRTIEVIDLCTPEADRGPHKAKRQKTA